MVLDKVITLSEQILPGVRAIQDPFSQELIKLWDDRKLEGKIFYALNERWEPIGYLLLDTVVRDRWTIRGFFVREDYRGQGYGKKLLQVATYFCKSFDKDTFVNITEGAEKIYLDEGYEILGRREDFPDQFRAVKKAIKTSVLIPEEKRL